MLVTTSGVSMEPLLHDKHKKNATQVLIVSNPSGDYKVGDMPLVLMSDGKYILHRIVKIISEQGDITYVTRGDNCITTEQVKPEQMLGIVSEIYYRKRVLKTTDTRYRFYAKMWSIVYPARKLYKNSRNFCSKCKCFLLAKTKKIG